MDKIKKTKQGSKRFVDCYTFIKAKCTLAIIIRKL